MDSVPAVVIGAGVVGLACARELARRGVETLIVERHAAIGSETSSRNSEVIHAGLYYPAASLKAQLCVAGRRQLYDFCARQGVNHRRCGKLVVATTQTQEPQLEALYARGTANGVENLQRLSAAEARRLEPQLACGGALLSPVTGIVDSHGLMLALLGDAERAGAVLALRSPVGGGTIADNGVALHGGNADDWQLRATIVINAAGLAAPQVAASLRGFPRARLPATYPAKGSYFALRGRSPFAHLVYPLPEVGGLGVHLTLDLAGQARFGPDVEWLAPIPPGAACPAFDYAVDATRASVFCAAIRRYWPALPDDALLPAYAGVRPKLSGPTDAAADFVIQGPAEHGIDGLVNLFGIESPGLTACLALAERVVASLPLD